MSSEDTNAAWFAARSSTGNAIMRDPAKGVLLITHYQRLLDYVKPDKVHVLAKGRIVTSGGPELALQLENEGYEAVVA